MQNKAMRVYQESVTYEQTDMQAHGQTDARKVIPMCRYASQANETQIVIELDCHIFMSLLFLFIKDL